MYVAIVAFRNWTAYVRTATWRVFSKHFRFSSKHSQEGDVVGVVVDADERIDARWRSVHDIFVTAGYENVPEVPFPDGTILEAPGSTLLPHAGVWLMPDNRTNGILEDFHSFLVVFIGGVGSALRRGLRALVPLRVLGYGTALMYLSNRFFRSEGGPRSAVDSL